MSSLADTPSAASPIDHTAPDIADYPTTPDKLLAWLDAMPPLARALVGSVLVDNQHKPAISAVRAGAVAELVADARARAVQRPYEDVAAQLGVSSSAVNHALTAHRRRVREATAGAPEVDQAERNGS